MNRRAAALVLPLLLAVSGALALEIPTAPQPGARWGYVSDFAGALTDAQKDALEAKLKALDASDSTQVAVVVLKSLEGDSLEGFSVRLAQGWGIGRKGKDNGALLLVALEDRAVRIEVGYGLEGKLTDAVSGMIVRNEIIPCFKQGDVAGGVTAGAEAIAAVVRGEYAAPRGSGTRTVDAGVGIFLLIFLILFLLIFIRASRAAQLGMILGAGRRGGFGGFSGGGFSSGGSSGFGGFGGGGFGGGGASGRW